MGPPAENEQADCQKTSLPRSAQAISLNGYRFLRRLFGCTPIA
jgi:hypothetical protein